MRQPNKPYCIPLRTRQYLFATEAEARVAANDYFARTGIVVTIIDRRSLAAHPPVTR